MPPIRPPWQCQRVPALAARALKNRGARAVVAYCTHPVLSGSAVERIATSALDELVVTDTIPLRAEQEHALEVARHAKFHTLQANAFKDRYKAAQAVLDDASDTHSP